MIPQQTSSRMVPVDVLNNHYQPLARYDARLLDLQGDWATLILPSDTSVTCLHWGSLIRFTFKDGQHRCEAEGIVVAHCIAEAMEIELETEASSSADSNPSLRPPGREITVHLWQCRQQEERRLGPRRRSQIAVLVHPEHELSPAHHALPEALNDTAEACWERGWAVDFSANGMRLRTHGYLPLKQRVALQFALPVGTDNTDERGQKRRFTVTGRVLRSERTRTAASHQAMICFEQLTSEDGLALSRFLHGD